MGASLNCWSLSQRMTQWRKGGGLGRSVRAVHSSKGMAIFSDAILGRIAAGVEFEEGDDEEAAEVDGGAVGEVEVEAGEEGLDGEHFDEGGEAGGGFGFSAVERGDDAADGAVVFGGVLAGERGEDGVADAESPLGFVGVGISGDEDGEDEGGAFLLEDGVDEDVGFEVSGVEVGGATVDGVEGVLPEAGVDDEVAADDVAGGLIGLRAGGGEGVDEGECDADETEEEREETIPGDLGFDEWAVGHGHSLPCWGREEELRREGGADGAFGWLRESGCAIGAQDAHGVEAVGMGFGGMNVCQFIDIVI